MRPTAVVEARRLRHEWWRSPEASAHVTAYMGEAITYALVAWQRDGADYHSCSRLLPQGRANPLYLEFQARKARHMAAEVLAPPAASRQRTSAVVGRAPERRATGQHRGHGAAIISPRMRP